VGTAAAQAAGIPVVPTMYVAMLMAAEGRTELPLGPSRKVLKRELRRAIAAEPR
jgi:hypothetical protein